MTPDQKRKLKAAIQRLVNDEVRLSWVGSDPEEDEEEIRKRIARHNTKIDQLINEDA